MAKRSTPRLPTRAATASTTFDGDGRRTLLSATWYTRCVLIDSNGKIVVAGQGGTSQQPWSNCYSIVRLNADGSFDTTFGSGGKVTNATFAYASNDAAYALSIQGDGKIAVAGYSTPSGGSQNFAIARYNADGSLDAGFGTGGRSTADFAGASDGVYSMARDAGGRFVVVGYSGADLAIARFHGVTAAATTGTQRQWVQQDANFNVTSVADSAGAVLERYRYTAYGEQTVLNAAGSAALSTSAIGNNVGSQGGRRDLSTGEILRNAGGKGREYLPVLGIWAGRDTGRYIDGLNLYRYVRNGPVSGLDSRGTETHSEPLHIVLGIYKQDWDVPGFVNDLMGSGSTVYGPFTPPYFQATTWLDFTWIWDCDHGTSRIEATPGLTGQRSFGAILLGFGASVEYEVRTANLSGYKDCPTCGEERYSVDLRIYLINKIEAEASPAELPGAPKEKLGFSGVRDVFSKTYDCPCKKKKS